LDEPTRGLHLEDITRLLAVLNQLVEEGNTVLVVEHHLDVIKCADWVIDLGPGGGESGGYIVAEGPPEAIANTSDSITGKYLEPLLAP
jgi:excinuclease ABC subunit A